MARNLSGNGRGRGRPRKNGNNPFGDAQEHVEQIRATNRSEAIRTIYTDLANLEAERGRVGREIAELKQKRVKGDLGMKIANFNIGYRVYKLEHGDRDELFDTLRECFSALGVGEQLDFVSAMRDLSTMRDRNVEHINPDTFTE